jgi:geranylgeranyl pyrophosphate synthase
MCTFFRFSHPEFPESTPLYHLLLSDLDHGTGETITVSQADPTISRWMEGCTGSNLDPDLVTAYRDELRESGVPHPIITGPAGSSVEGDPFSIHWGDFSFRTGDDGQTLRFRRPGDRDPCSFTLEPAAPAWFCQGFSTDHRDGMAYASIPRLKVMGTVGGDPVTGEAWADHQWGGLGWFQGLAPTDDGGWTVLGWDWYAITLDPGIDIMLLVHRDMADRRIRSQWCLIMENGRMTVSPDFSLGEPGLWKSPRTGISYPLESEISFPGLDCRLTVTPFSPDQEIPIPGPMRAVWEGAATVRGTFMGSPVTGRARVELCGYGYIFDFNQVLASISREIDHEIARFIPRVLDEKGIAELIRSPDWQGEPRVYSDMIAGPALEMIRRNKKYYRPLYAILLLHALGVDPEPYMDLVCTIPELTHTGALIIDDIEDASLIRRSAPCIHLIYGTDTAINAANTLYYLPWLLVEHHPRLEDRQRLLLYQNMVKSAVKAHIGQGTDIWWSHHRSPEEIFASASTGLDKKILQVHADKTGVAGEQVANGCCIIADASLPVRDACIRYSRNLWIAFQIMDDIRDIMGGTAWNKNPGGDIASGKMSYVIAKALMMLPEEDRARLAFILAYPPCEKDEPMIREGIALVKKSGAVDICRKEVTARFAEEWQVFSRFIQPGESKVMLRAFSQKMLRD